MRKISQKHFNLLTGVAFLRKIIFPGIYSLVLGLITIFLCLLPSFASTGGSTTEIYLAPGKDGVTSSLQSNKPNTISIDENEIAAVLEGGTKLPVETHGHASLQTQNDFYLTIKYLFNTDKLYFYNHGKKIGTISLKGKDFNVHEMINDLRGKQSHIAYLKTHNTPLSDKRIKLNYKRTYPSVKISPSKPDDDCRGESVCSPKDGQTHGSAPTGPQSHLAQYTLLTTNLVLNLDASNLDNAGNSADSSDTSTTWTDRSGNSNNGTLTNFTLPTGTSASGWDGANTPANPSVLKFDGTNDYADVSDSTSLSPTSTLTVSTWVNQSSLAANRTIIAKWAASTRDTWAIEINDADNTRLQLNIADSLTDNGLNYGRTPSGSWSTGWHFISLVYDGSGSTNADKLKCYIDGIQQTLTFTGTIASSLTDSTAPIRLGSLQNNGEYFNGKISNVRIYSTALTAEQIRTNYLAEAYKFQGTDNVAPGIYGEEDLRTATYKKAGDTFDVYVEDVNPNINGDSDVNGINSLTCMLGSTSLTTPSATEQNFTGGLTFNGSNNYADCTDINAIDGTATLTVSHWIKTSSNGFYVFSSKSDAGATAGWLFQTVSGDNTDILFYFGSNASNGKTTNDLLTAGVWHHLTAVYDGNGSTNADKLKIYIDGNSQSLTFTGTLPTTITATSTSVRLGGWQGGTAYFSGSIANARIYNRALSAAEIARDYRSPYEPSNPTGLVAWYKLDDGNVSSNTTTTAAARKWDTATNAIVTDTSLNGTLTNFGFGSANGWVNQYSFNRNKYTFTVPSLTGANQVEKLQCTATDAWSNSTTTNEEVGGVFISKAPTVSTNVTANSTIMTGDTIAVTVTDTTPDATILSSPTTPAATIDGNSFSSTCSITPTTVTKAISFDGTDDYVNVAHNSSLDVSTTNQYTISYWLNFDVVPTSRKYTIDKQQTGFKGYYSLIDPNSVIVFPAPNGSTWNEISTANQSFSAGTWYHIVGTYNGSTVRIYLNATEVKSQAVNATLASSTNNLNIGRYNGGDAGFYIDGSIDDTQIYNRALSPNEITYLYNNPSKIFNGNGLVGYWRFDQLEDTNSNSVVDNVRDYSSNSNHGTLTNYASLSSALVDSTVTNSIDGRTGSCNISVTNSNPTGPSNVTNKTLTTSVTNAASLTGTETKTVSLSRNQNPNTPTISSVTIAGSNAGTSGSYTVNYNQLLVINFSASDPDSDPVTLSTSSLSIGRFTAASAASPGTGTFTFIPAPLDQNRTYTFTVRATDSNSAASGDLQVTINVPPSQNAQSLIDAGNQYIQEEIKKAEEANKPKPPKPAFGEPPQTPKIPEEDLSLPKPPELPRPPKPLPPDFQPIDISKFPKPGPPKPPIVVVPLEDPSSPSAPQGKPPTPEPPKGTDISALPPIEAEFPKIPENLLPPKPKEEPKPSDTTSPEVPKGTTQNSNVILAGNPTSFTLPADLDIVKELTSESLSDLDVQVRIIDSFGNEFEVNASVLLSLAPNKLLVIQTDIIPLDVSDGQGVLLLIINDKPKANINIVISHAQTRAGSETGEFKPVIKQVKTIRTGNILKLIITGGNFFDTLTSKTEITMLPSGGLEKKEVKILKGGKTIIATYKILEKELQGQTTLIVVNSFGQVNKVIEIPAKGKTLFVHN